MVDKEFNLLRTLLKKIFESDREKIINGYKKPFFNKVEMKNKLSDIHIALQNKPIEFGLVYVGLGFRSSNYNIPNCKWRFFHYMIN